MPTYRKRNGKWRVEIRRKGVYQSATFYTKAEAVAWALQTEREIDTGRLSKRSTATLADAFARYSRDVSPQKRGRRWEQIRLKRLSGSRLADIRLCALTADDLTQWRDGRAQEVAAASVNRELGLIRSVLKQARLVWGWLDHDPLRHVSRLQPPPPRDRRISDDEIQRLCWALGYSGGVPRAASQHVAVMFLLAIETGMRLGELCGLRRKDIHGRYLRLERTKNADRRDVPLSQRAMRLLSLPAGEKLFPVRSETASVLFRRARIRAGIADLTFHDSRHEACTRLARKLDVLDLARMLGHRDIRSLQAYYNATATEIAARLDAADDTTAALPLETSADDRQSAPAAESQAGK